MAVGNLGEPRYIQYTELRDGENEPNGRPDVFNRPAKDWYTSYTVEHDYATGAHASTGCMVIEEGTYTGNGVDNRNISLTNSSLDIIFILIWRDGTTAPVLRSTDMAGDNSKIAQVNAFQANMIQSIATTGQFQVGTDNAVNQNTIDYYYIVGGTE